MKEIQLTQGKVALVDDEDYERLRRFIWTAKLVKEGNYSAWYAQRERRQSEPSRPRMILLHRAVLNPPSHIKLDHKNGNSLDCRRENLRPATDSQNQLNRGKARHNTSGFKGVSRKGNRWRAYTRFQKHAYHLGHFDTAEDAARAYDAFAKKHHGEFARLNFSDAEVEQ